MTWDSAKRNWVIVEAPVEETPDNTRELISTRYQQIGPDYVRFDGKIISLDSLREKPELISLETVRNLMDQLTNNNMTVDELSWVQCAAILKYLDNDQSVNIT
jgi:hypothetical protein